MADMPNLRQDMTVKAGGKEWVIDRLITYSHTLRPMDDSCVNCNQIAPGKDDPCAPPTVRLRHPEAPAIVDQPMWQPRQIALTEMAGVA